MENIQGRATIQKQASEAHSQVTATLIQHSASLSQKAQNIAEISNELKDLGYRLVQYVKTPLCLLKEIESNFNVKSDQNQILLATYIIEVCRSALCGDPILDKIRYI